MKPISCSRRSFLRKSAIAAAGLPCLRHLGIPNGLAQTQTQTPTAHPSLRISPDLLSNAKVSIVPCKSYGPQVRPIMKQCFDHLGGVGRLVKNKTVTVKINMTGTNFTPHYNRPVGERFMTHPDTAMTLASLLFEAGAKRVRFVESTQSWANLEQSLSFADWDINEFSALGTVQFENTRNLGLGKKYSNLKVPTGGYMFSEFEFNHAYADTDVMISLCKLKNHVTAGVTLSMKNMFGITPNSLYGGEAPSEEARKGRGPLHNPTGHEALQLPGLKPGQNEYKDPGYRVPHIIADICTARPIHLSIIDGITSMKGGEGPWVENGGKYKVEFTEPGVMIAGLNPVSTDAVGTAVIGYDNPRAERGSHPFEHCDNHIRLAEQAGVGTADLSQIEVLGSPIKEVIYPYS